MFDGMLDGVTDIGDVDSGISDESGDAPKRTRKRRSDAGKPRSSGTGTRRTSSSKLADELLVPYSQLAKSLAFSSPTLAAVLMERGEKTTRALVQIAEKHPRMLEALKKTSQIGPAADIGETLVMAVIALQMDLGRIPPSHPIAVALGVAPLYEAMHGPTVVEGEAFSAPFESAVPQAPPTFTYGMSNDPRNPMYSFNAGQGAGSLA